MDEKEKFFYERTNRHKDLVKKYCAKIVEAEPKYRGLLFRGDVHDNSKFSEPELTPYIELTWAYKMSHGKDIEETPEIINAVLHHYKVNSHHPEYHDPFYDKDAYNDENYIVDAVNMPELDLAEMCSDWYSMSQEFNGDTRDWFNKNNHVKWEFGKSNEQLILHLIDILEVK